MTPLQYQALALVHRFNGCPWQLVARRLHPTEPTRWKQRPGVLASLIKNRWLIRRKLGHYITHDGLQALYHHETTLPAESRLSEAQSPQAFLPLTYPPAAQTPRLLPSRD